MLNPDLASYKILQGKLIQALESPDPVGSCLEQGIGAQERALLLQISQDPALKGAPGPLKWLPGLAQDLLEEFEAD